MRIFPSTILPIYGKIGMRFCPYTKKQISQNVRLFKWGCMTNGNENVAENEK